MFRNLSIYCLSILFFFSVLPSTTRAMPAITCHCFTDRSYDPAHPSVADPYFLATTQNRFFAAVFGVEKSTIVMKKQTGTPMRDLWIAYWIAKKTGTSPEYLLEKHQEKADWSDTLSALKLPLKALGKRFVKELMEKNSDAFLADTIVDEILEKYRLLDPAELTKLRKQGADSRELILAIAIAAKTGQSVDRLFMVVKMRKKSWGELLNDAGIDSAGINGAIASLLRKSS